MASTARANGSPPAHAAQGWTSRARRGELSRARTASSPDKPRASRTMRTTRGPAGAATSSTRSSGPAESTRSTGPRHARGRAAAAIEGSKFGTRSRVQVVQVVGKERAQGGRTGRGSVWRREPGSDPKSGLQIQGLDNRPEMAEGPGTLHAVTDVESRRPRAGSPELGAPRGTAAWFGCCGAGSSGEGRLRQRPGRGSAGNAGAASIAVRTGGPERCRTPLCRSAAPGTGIPFCGAPPGPGP